MKLNPLNYCLLLSLIFIAFISCTKNQIQFGSDLGQTFTNVMQVDTVAINMSTVVLDSFATSTDSNLLFGRYKDPFLGIISTKPYLQFSPPSSPTLSSDAVYDSLVLIVKLNGNYYGDTLVNSSFLIHELADPIEYSYAGKLYNTSSVSENSSILGIKQGTLSPSRDSLTVRLNDIKGKELFDKMMQDALEMQSSDAFSNYFHGISIEYNNNDTSAIYGIKLSPDNIKIRLYYHITIPYPQNNYSDFSFNSSLPYFEQVTTNRSPYNLLPGTEMSSVKTGKTAFSQAITGTMLKMTFPSLRNILQVDSTIRLLKATLVLRVPNGLFDENKYKLPQNLYLLQTNSTNEIGSIPDGTGSGTVQPVVDNIYTTPATVSFDLTTYINKLLATSGIQDYGLFLFNNSAGGQSDPSRIIINDSFHATGTQSQLLLTVLTINR